MPRRKQESTKEGMGTAGYNLGRLASESRKHSRRKEPQEHRS